MIETSVTARPEERVIPRPSERRPAIPSPSAGGSEARTGPRIDGIESAYRWFGFVGSATAAIGFGLLGLLERAPTVPAIVIIPLLTAATAIVLDRWVRPRAGAGFVSILLAGLAIRFLGAIPRLLAAADAELYQREGERLAVSFRQLDFAAPTGRAVPGTGSLRYLAGLVNVATNSTYVATYLVFVMIAFIGQVLFLLGVRRVLTARQFRLAAVLVMLWPSMAYWPSSIGKEAAVVFGLGLFVLGGARLYEREFRGIGLAVLGLVAVAMVRPHVALILLIALLVGLFAWRIGQRSRVVLHVAALALVAAGAMWLTDASASLVGLEQFAAIEDVSAALDFAQARTSQDQARFAAVRVDSVLAYPWAAVTVLIRPFPWEAPNSLAVLSSIEGVALGLLAAMALPGLIGERAKFLTRGLLLSATVFSAVFVFLFSALGNFGILTRQRVQVIPFVLLFIAIGLGYERHRSPPRLRRLRP